jgi:dTDP-glucose 4,6-dehydratase
MPRQHPLPQADLDLILAECRRQGGAAFWEPLRGARLFITGGTGFFGSWLLESFVHANDQLGLGAHATVLSRDPDAFRARRPLLAANHALNFIAGDVRDFTFPIDSFSHCIHAATAASAKLNEESPLEMLDSIVEGTRHVLDFAKAAGIKRLLLTSSGAVYGAQPPELPHVGEDYAGSPDVTHPASAYGEGKRLAELLCATYARAYGIEIPIARCFAFVGPHLPLDSHFAIGNFIRDAMAGGPVRVGGDGTPMRSYLYAADLAVWLWTILLQGPSLRPFNVGSDEAHSIADIARAVAATLSTPEEPISVEFAREADPSKPRLQYVPSTERARTELGLRQSVPLADAIARTAGWHRGR